MNRPREQVDLWLQGCDIVSSLSKDIFTEMEEVNAHDSRIGYGNEHIEISVGISIGLVRHEVMATLRLEDNPDILREVMRDQLRKVYLKLTDDGKTT